MQKIDEYERNGSRGVLEQFLELDVRIVTYTPWVWNINEDEDNYDEENEESGELLKTMNL